MKDQTAQRTELEAKLSEVEQHWQEDQTQGVARARQYEALVTRPDPAPLAAVAGTPGQAPVGRGSAARLPTARLLVILDAAARSASPAGRCSEFCERDASASPLVLL